ncbi:MAG: hypothetical protein DRH43_05530 [Deltaproteobacteria bacterium]|nr:MAG: hypothetical protein DRH43_05530 [Deltaproteobacteria bacterium]
MRHIAAVILVFFFLANLLTTGFLSGDVDGNSKIDLKDAIIAVQALQILSESGTDSPLPGSKSLTAYLVPAVKAFRALSGCETRIQKEDQKTVSAASAFLAVYSSQAFSHIPSVTIFKEYKDIPFQSVDPKQATPPPQPFC